MLFAAVPLGVLGLGYPPLWVGASSVALAYVLVVAVDAGFSALLRRPWWTRLLERARSPWVQRLLARPGAFWPAVLLMLAGAFGGLVLAPEDYQQKDAFRIIYVHVPSASLSLTSTGTIGTSCRPASCEARQRRSPAMIS